MNDMNKKKNLHEYSRFFLSTAQKCITSFQVTMKRKRFKTFTFCEGRKKRDDEKIISSFSRNTCLNISNHLPRRSSEIVSPFPGIRTFQITFCEGRHKRDDEKIINPMQVFDSFIGIRFVEIFLGCEGRHKRDDRKFNFLIRVKVMPRGKIFFNAFQI